MSKEKEYTCYFEGETYVMAKNIEEVREKAYQKLRRKADEFIDLEDIYCEDD